MLAVVTVIPGAVEENWERVHQEKKQSVLRFMSSSECGHCLVIHIKQFLERSCFRRRGIMQARIFCTVM